MLGSSLGIVMVMVVIEEPRRRFVEVALPLLVAGHEDHDNANDKE